MTNNEVIEKKENKLDQNNEIKRIGSTFLKGCAEDAKPRVEKLGADLFSLAYQQFLNWLNGILAA